MLDSCPPASPRSACFRKAEADYIIELGPVGGPQGGELLYQGTLPGLLKQKASPTAPYLKAKLNR